MLKIKLSRPDSNEILDPEKLNELFEKHNCALQVILSVGFNLQNVDTEECRLFYAQEKNKTRSVKIFICFSRHSFVLSSKPRQKDSYSGDVYTGEKKYNAAITTNVTIFCALLNIIPIR